jgi:hypothetical protein
MARKIDQSLWDAWHRRIQRQQRSGLSIAEFCRNERISQGSFHTWKRKLRRATPAPRLQANNLADTRRRGTGSMGAALLASTGAADFVQVPLATVGATACIEVALVDGTVVRVPQHNLAALTTILRLLRAEGNGTSPSETEASNA